MKQFLRDPQFRTHLLEMSSHRLGDQVCKNDIKVRSVNLISDLTCYLYDLLILSGGDVSIENNTDKSPTADKAAGMELKSNS